MWCNLEAQPCKWQIRRLLTARYKQTLGVQLILTAEMCTRMHAHSETDVLCICRLCAQCGGAKFMWTSQKEQRRLGHTGCIQHCNIASLIHLNMEKWMQRFLWGMLFDSGNVGSLQVSRLTRKKASRPEYLNEINGTSEGR